MNQEERLAAGPGHIPGPLLESGKAEEGLTLHKVTEGQIVAH